MISKRIFVAERDHELLALRIHALEHIGYEVIACHAMKNILPAIHWMVAEKSNQVHIDLVICDATLLSDVAIEKIIQKQRNNRFPPLILIAESSNSEMLAQTAALKCNAIFDKNIRSATAIGCSPSTCTYSIGATNAGGAIRLFIVPQNEAVCCIIAPRHETLTAPFRPAAENHRPLISVGHLGGFPLSGPVKI